MDQDRPLICETPKSRIGCIIIQSGVALAVVALGLLLSSGIGVRVEMWHFRTGFVLLKYAAYCGGTALLITVAGMFLSAGKTRKYLVLVIAAISVALTTVIIPVYWKVTAGRMPRIHDISTDTANPPEFIAVLPLRKDASNTTVYGGLEIAVRQHEAYPDIKPLVLNLSFEQAFVRALDVARDMKWEIVSEVPEEGRIEATDTTFWFGFKDDIVVRITAVGSVRSVVDIRSVSRIGVSDVGANAARVRSFLERMNK